MTNALPPRYLGRREDLALGATIDLDDLRAAADVVYRHMPATPQYRWPLLSARAGCAVWVKHENHTPIGAFKLRGALNAISKLDDAQKTRGVACASTGNHGRAVASVSYTHLTLPTNREV